MTAGDAPLWLAYRVVGGRPSYSRDDVACATAAVEHEFLTSSPTTTLTSRQCANVLVRDG